MIQFYHIWLNHLLSCGSDLTCLSYRPSLTISIALKPLISCLSFWMAWSKFLKFVSFAIYLWFIISFLFISVWILSLSFGGEAKVFLGFGADKILLILLNFISIAGIVGFIELSLSTIYFTTFSIIDCCLSNSPIIC